MADLPEGLATHTHTLVHLRFGDETEYKMLPTFFLYVTGDGSSQPG